MLTNSILLQQANEAYHKLQMGIAARVVVDIDGSRVEFVPANASKLYAYIQQLQSKVNVDKGIATPNMYAPATFVF